MDKYGKWNSGRFRDIYLNEDGTKILLYTRNGGGNREHWSDEKDQGEECACTGCIINYHLPKHPLYIRDYDDDFDCTYATVEFNVPEEYVSELKSLATGKKPLSVSDKFQKLVESMKKGEKTEETDRAEQVGKKIFNEINKKPSSTVITIDSKDGEFKKEN